MTPAEVRALSDERLRVETAKALGWTNLEIRRNRPDAMGTWFGVHPQYGRTWLPNWPCDLNACAELRREIEKRALLFKYLGALDKVVGGGGNDWQMANATARQHAEAALLALQREEI